MRDNVATLVYSCVLGIVCAALLTVVGKVTGPRWEANRKAEEVRNILGVLGVPYDAGATAEELVALFNKDVRTERLDGLTAYVYGGGPQGGEAKAVAIPFSGPGLWGPIKGILALEPDMRTIRGITFYEQEETPGLGGDIATERFQSRFKGKSIVGPDGKPAIRLVQGGNAKADNEVDAITGATLTSQKVEQMLTATAGQIVKAGGGAHGQ
jgi:Na+-transporting NADH:ubiquinone oxidoreductase subunit C